jgi:uncharacterized protein YcfJ
MTGYTNYQLPPNYGYQQQQQQYQQQPQQQYPSQYPQYSQAPPSYNASSSSYPRPAPAPVSAPLPANFYQQVSSPAPSMYSASTMSTYSTPSVQSSSSDDLMGFFNPSPQAMTAPQAPRPVTPSQDDMQVVLASQQRALAETTQRDRNARSLSPMVQRKDYNVPRDAKGKHVISDAIHPEKYLMKKSRKQRTVAGAGAGAIVGGLLTGPAFPVGMAIGAAAGGYASNKMHKFNERNRQRRHEQRNFQKAAKNTAVAKSNDCVFV